MKTHFQKQTSLIARWLQTVFILVAMIVVGQQANAQAPGGVTTGLRLWLKANDGTNTTTQGGSISSWQDKSGLGFHVVQTNANWQPFYHENARNFNPVVRFTGSESIGNTKANLIIPATTNPMTLINAFQCTRTTALYHTLVSFGGGADYPSDHINGDKYLSYVEATSHVATYHPTLLEGKFTVGYSTHANLAGTAGVRQIGFNGLQNMYLPPITDGTFPAGGFTGNFSVGAQKPDGIAEPFVGDIPEVIVYNRVLTNVELQKAQSYIALKYGITMDKATNYLNSSGSIMWPATQDYGSNVFGIARDDASALNQKVSQSTDAGGVLKMALQNDFVSSNQDASRTVSLVDGQSLMVGDNGQPLSLYTTFALSCGSIANSVKLSTVWKVANINSVGGVILKMDFAASGINDQPYIIIGSSPTFGAGTYRKIDGTMNDDGTTATFTVKLKNGEYFTFGGVRGAGVCPKCAYSSTTLEWDKAPFWPIPTASNTAVTRTLGTGQNLSMIFNDPQGVEFAKGVRPIRYGKTLLLDRWDNLTPTGTPNGGAYTGVFTMDKASKVKFDINAIDRWAVDCKDIVEIKGYCGTTLIMPILTAVDEAHKTFTISGNVATGNSKWSGYFDKRGKLNVYFDRAVNKIEIIWKSTKGGTGNRFQRIGIGNVQFICPEVDDVCAMNDDDVIFKRLIADGVTAKKTCENLRFEYKLKNLSCVVAKVVNLTDVLPAGMAWITDGYEAGTYGGTTNAYAGTTNLSVTSITIPPGMEISVFASAKFTNTGSAGYANKASITVNGGTVGAIQSNCGNNNTWSSTSAQPAPVPTISHTVDKTCYKQNEVLTFTVTVNNTTGAAITGVEFKTALEGKFTMVGSSVSTTLGGTIALPDGQSSYDGLEFLEITGMSIPTGTSTFAYQVRTNTSDSTFVMKSTISADPNSDCAEEASQKTNEITLAPCPPCTAGTAVPVITQTTATNTCPAITVNLATMTNTGTKPAGTNLVWSTRKTPNSPTDTLSNLNVGAGKYYALYRDKVSGCFGTGGADSVMVTISLCVSTPSPRIPSAGGNDSGNAGTELNPIGGTQPYNYTNGSGDAGCVAPTGSPAYQYLPSSSNLTINGTTGVYSYTAPTIPGNYYFCMKVCDSSTPAKCNVAVYKVNVSGNLPSFGGTPPVQNPLPGGSGGGNAPIELLPVGGTQPYNYTNGSGDAGCVAPTGSPAYQYLPSSSNLTINGTTGVYSYTAPTIPGNYYFCMKVCDSSTPAKCNVAVYKVNVSAAAAGTIDCNKTQIIPAPIAGLPSQNILAVTVNVTTTGTFTPITINGSGMSLANGITSVSTETTGIQTLYIPIKYNGTALGIMNFTIGTTATCSADLSSIIAKKKVITDVWTLDNCSSTQVGPKLK